MTRRRMLEAVAGTIATIALTACSLAPPFSTAPSTASNRAPIERDAAAHYKLLYAFGRNGKPDDGRTPLANLVAIGDTLYGTTAYGGTTSGGCSVGCGTLFRVSRAGSEVVLHRFTSGASDGAIPIAGPIAAGGALYGTTSAGGGARTCAGGCGTVFASNPRGNTRVLHRFGGGSDGAQPAAALISVNGVLYGTTTNGGRSTPCPMGCGTVFSLSPTGANEKVIYEFKGGADGEQPAGTLVALGGELYGTTQYGGRRTPFCATGCGTVFRLEPDGGGETVLYRFAYGPRNPDGAYPAAGLTAVSGVLYGTAAGGGLGGGTVFSIRASDKAQRTLHFFDPSANDGVHPDARLVLVNGLLYGTTRDGGTRTGGTIFQISRGGTERVLYSFAGKPDGARPQAELSSLAGTLYGTTALGGATSGGTVFGFTP
ncbi:MAG TPA: choice-of-anchor tandem repeat GloVer-containing protein [Candidatus Binatia bacterium]|nr:choice-of-anchor tandem repeat GloVer-containing protein [Candidatus Binatia bacterium]